MEEEEKKSLEKIEEKKENPVVVEKNLKEKEPEKEEKPTETKEELKKPESKENKTLRNFFIGAVVCIGLILVIVFFLNSIRTFDYKGLTGSVVKEGNLIFYQIGLPVIHEGQEKQYNFYLRNDPRKLDEISFDGNMFILKDIVINISEEFNPPNCEGDGIIAMQNLASLYNVIGVNVVRDPSASCDDVGKYGFLNIQPGKTTKIKRVGPGCYNLFVGDCEILEVTEKLMVEILVNLKERDVEIIYSPGE